MAILITTTGKIKKRVPGNGTDFMLTELQGFVGGLIEIIEIPNSDLIMVVNEEGKYGYAINTIATIYARMNMAIAPNDYISGNVLLCKSEMVE